MITISNELLFVQSCIIHFHQGSLFGYDMIDI